MKKFYFITVMIVVFSFPLSSYSFNKSDCTCNQSNKKAVIKLIDEVWNKKNFSDVDKLIAPQYTIRHDPGDQWEGKTINLSTYKNRVKTSLDALPDQHFYIEDLVCNGNKVAISWKFTATHKGKIPGLPVTNKKVSVSGMTIYYFSEGKIIGHWQVVDRLGFLQQLGISKKNPQN